MSAPTLQEYENIRTEAIHVAIGIPKRLFPAVQEVVDRANHNFTGSITIHFQDGNVREIEQHTRKRLKKQD